MIVREYVHKRQEFVNSRKRNHIDEPCKRHQSQQGTPNIIDQGLLDCSDSEDFDPSKKPRLEQFIKRFEAEVKRVN